MKLRSLFCCALLLLGGFHTLVRAETPKIPVFTFQYDHLLGTSVELRVLCPTSEMAEAVERTALAEIERLAAVLSSYDAQSEFSRWARRQNSESKVSRELFEALAASDRWREASGGAFSPGAESVCRLWKEAAKTGRLPSAAAKQEAARQSLQPGWKLEHATQTATRIGSAPLTLDAIAEGLIVDRVITKIRGLHPQATGLLLNIGGDLCSWGAISQSVAIVDPAHDAENSAPLCRVILRDESLVTSGGYRRGVEIEGKWHSHIVDPRTGEPTEKVRSASVIAANTADADALATILCVLPIAEGLALIEKQPKAACLVVDATGGVHRSVDWSKYELPAEQSLFTSAPLSPEGEKFELEIELEINKPSGGRGYRRPYVAVWIEDKDNLPVRTLAVWTQRTGPGPRWLPDLKKWYKSEQLRKLADGTEIIDTVSSATRSPGKYKLTWDGLDDAGKPVKPGKFTVLIEAAREHGTYQVIRSQYEFDGKKAFKAELKGNEEIKGATLDYRQRTAASK